MTETNEKLASDPGPADTGISASAPIIAAPIVTAPAAPVVTAGGQVQLVQRRASEADSRPHEGGLHRVVGFIAWVFSGFGITHAFRKHGSFSDQEIIVYSAHRAFFLWPLVFTGFIGGFIVHHWPSTSVFMGWFYVAVLTYTLVSLLFDISTLKFLLCAGILAFIYVLCRLVELKWKVFILHDLFVLIDGLQPKLDKGFAIIMSWLLLIPWIGALFSTFTNGRKRFTPNEISEWHLGDGRELTDRSGLKFRSKYRDVFETLLGFGAGDLMAIDGTGVVRKHWENILFLFFIWNRMDEILHQRAAVVDNQPDEPVEVEEVRPTHHHPSAHS